MHEDLLRFWLLGGCWAAGLPGLFGAVWLAGGKGGGGRWMDPFEAQLRARPVETRRGIQPQQ